MDFRIINSLVCLDIALSLHKVSMHLTSAFIPSKPFEKFNSFRLFRALCKRITITRNAESIQKLNKKKTTKKPSLLLYLLNKHERTLTLQRLNYVVFLLLQRTNNATYFVCYSGSKCKLRIRKITELLGKHKHEFNVVLL